MNLAILVEQKVDVDSEGGKVDFNDRNTYECLFKEYWFIINEKERLTLEDLFSADRRLKKGVFFKNGSDSDQFEGDEDLDFDESMDSVMDSEPSSLMGKVMNVFTPTRLVKKANSKKREFDGWGSKALRDFLKKISKDSNKPLSQNEVEDIIKKYISEFNLMDPERKKMVRCDTVLQSIFGRKSIKRNKIYNNLECHFAENLEQSEEDLWCSDDTEDATPVSCKRQRRMNSTRRTNEKEKVLETPQSHFASVTAENIKLVYLKRSLIEELLKNSETFDEKVTGSFIRVKSDPNDYFQENPYQLMQVTGISKDGGINSASKEVTLYVSNARKNFQISRLSDENFLEEEIEDLQKKVKEGLLKKLTIVELERKARSLHEDLTKHWIKKELVRLQNLSDRANEKGWRSELLEYLKEIKKLRTESHQQQLIQEVPKVIAEKIEHEVSLDLTEDDNLVKDNTPMQILLPGNSAALVDIADLGNRAGGSECMIDTIDKRAAEEGTEDMHNRAGGQNCSMDTTDKRAVEKSIEVMLDLQNVAGDKDVMDTIGGIDSSAVKDTEGNGGATLSISEGHENGKHLAMQVSVEHSSERHLIVLDEEEEDMGIVLDEKQGDTRTVLDDKEGDIETQEKKCNQEPINVDSDDDEITESKIWYYVDPEGVTQGTFSMSQLGSWYDGYFKMYPDFKVWKVGQSKEEAILLKDALGRC